MKLFFGSALLIAALSTGCSRSIGNEYSITIDNSFSPEYQQAAVQGVQMWKNVLGQNLKINSLQIGSCGNTATLPFQSGGENKICVRPCTAMWLTHQGEADTTLAITNQHFLSNTADVWIATDRDDVFQEAEIARIIGHEMGHAFQLEHINDPANLMYWEISDQQTEPTCNDAAEYFALRNMSSKTEECSNGGSFFYYH